MYGMYVFSTILKFRLNDDGSILCIIVIIIVVVVVYIKSLAESTRPVVWFRYALPPPSPPFPSFPLPLEVGPLNLS